VAAAGAVLVLDGGVIAQAGVGLTAVGAPHFCAPEAEDHLRGKPPTGEVFAQAARIAAEHCDPHSDQRGPADYKRHLAAELTRRALSAAAERI
jgi:carbon-monoxide dehydrogenase medium subunit